jgi:hypothetical protein
VRDAVGGDSAVNGFGGSGLSCANSAKWKRYDDALVRDIQEEEALRSGKTEGYLLFYEVKPALAALVPAAAATGATAS